MRSNAINLLSLGLSLLMVSTRAMPARYQSNVLQATQESTYLEINNFGFGPDSLEFKCVKAGIAFAVSQKKDWGFRRQRYEIKQDESHGLADSDVPEHGGSYTEFNVHLVVQTSSQSVKRGLIASGTITATRGLGASGVEFVLQSPLDIEDDTMSIGQKGSDNKMFKAKPNGQVEVVERESNVAAEQEPPKQKKKGKCCVM
ncbi:hypothetical protein EV361DRAFT_955237 [Lentinula raphanica]|nr:hypothetical protein EV361DRAFT_955237 [Lentinula raphanica]